MSSDERQLLFFGAMWIFFFVILAIPMWVGAGYEFGVASAIAATLMTALFRWIIMLPDPRR